MEVSLSPMPFLGSFNEVQALDRALEQEGPMVGCVSIAGLLSAVLLAIHFHLLSSGFL